MATRYEDSELAIEKVSKKSQQLANSTRTHHFAPRFFRSHRYMSEFPRGLEASIVKHIGGSGQGTVHVKQRNGEGV
jgi:hypothetical protein